MMLLWPRGLKGPFKSMHEGERELEQIEQKYFIPRVSNHTTVKGSAKNPNTNQSASTVRAALMHTANCPEKL